MTTADSQTNLTIRNATNRRNIGQKLQITCTWAIVANNQVIQSKYTTRRINRNDRVNTRLEVGNSHLIVYTCNMRPIKANITYTVFNRQRNRAASVASSIGRVVGQ